VPIFSNITYFVILILTLLFSAAYAQPNKSTSTSPLPSITFSNLTYDLSIQQPNRWHYRPELQGQQQSHYPELVLQWESDEYIFDTVDKKYCPQLADYTYSGVSYKKTAITDFVVYLACHEIAGLKSDDESVFDFSTNEHTGEVITTSIISGGDVEAGEFAQLNITRYIPVAIPNHDVESVLQYVYRLTIYDYADDAKTVLLQMLDKQGSQLTQSLLGMPIPQFILDKAKRYETGSIDMSH